MRDLTHLLGEARIYRRIGDAVRVANQLAGMSNIARVPLPPLTRERSFPVDELRGTVTNSYGPLRVVRLNDTHGPRSGKYVITRWVLGHGRPPRCAYVTPPLPLRRARADADAPAE